MNDLPAPLTPAACDLRDYPWMPLDVRRLLTSETWVLGSAEEKCASVSLWCESWQQVPAGSLPDNDRMLAHLSMSGAGWKKISAEVLKSWVKCSDGRLYHPVVAEKANEAWALKQAQKQRTEAARRAKAERAVGKIAGGSGSPDADDVTHAVAISVTEPVTTSVTDNVTSSTRQDKTVPDQTSISPSLRSGGRAPARSRACASQGGRLPEAWEPSADDVAFAQGLGLDAARVASRFRDYWHAKAGPDAMRADWSAVWRNWCREQAQRGLDALPATQPDDPPDGEAKPRSDEWARIMARWTADGCPGAVRPPSRQAWLSGDIPNRELWLDYPRLGPAIFRPGSVISGEAQCLPS